MEAAGADSIPYMVAPGNHEADCHDPACILHYEQYARPLANFTAYNARFRMPSAESGARALNMHYSFEVGPVHFVSLDLETGYPGAPEETRYIFPCGGFGDMVAWLEADLARVDRAATPWVFVAGHHPMYQGGSRNVRMADALEGLLKKYAVDAMFTGHIHSYERDYPAFGGALVSTSYVNPNATVHIMVGGGGNDEMGGDEAAPEDAAVARAAEAVERIAAADARAYEPVPNAQWTAVTDQGYFGIGVVSIANDTHMHFEYVRTTTATVHDDVWIVKDPARAREV